MCSKDELRKRIKKTIKEMMKQTFRFDKIKTEEHQKVKRKKKKNYHSIPLLEEVQHNLPSSTAKIKLEEIRGNCVCISHNASMLETYGRQITD